jgi:spermidine/putrescine transport system permease protein
MKLTKKTGYYAYGCLVLAVLYFPLVSIGVASFAKKRYFSFPIKHYTMQWYAKALESGTVKELLITSLTIAALVTLISVIVGFFGGLSYAKYSWKGRKFFQKLVVLPLFFPQSVLGLALLLWFNALGVIPSWKTAVISHLVWISPITTMIIAIQAYSMDPSVEEAAYDMGAGRWQTLTKITIPLLWPGISSAALFAFLLSWGNFALSMFTTGADSTLPEWLYAKMVSGYTPLIPALGILAMAGAIAVIILGIAFRTSRARIS